MGSDQSSGGGPDLELTSRRIVTPDGVRAGVVSVRGGRIVAVLPPDAPRGTAGRVDLDDAYLLPGLVDTHVHINDPGRAEWEGFATATRAAASGGVTTLVDMPLNSIPTTTTVDALRAKRAAAADRCTVDVGFWGGVVPGNERDLEGLATAGVAGFKCFMVPSGVDEFPHVGAADLARAMPVLARLGLPLLVHAEAPGPIAVAEASVMGRDPRAYSTYLASRPESAERDAIRTVLDLCASTKCAVHIVHLSSAMAIQSLRDAKSRGLPVTVETCPQYLTLAAEDVASGDTTYKCAPPIRERANREKLWEGLHAGVIDLIATDHSPCPPELKGLDSGNFFAAWGGIVSLGLALPLVWAEAESRGFGAADLVRWMSERPARLAGLSGRKGRIAAGYDADLVVWDPEPEWTVEQSRLFCRHRLTPYLGRRVRGEVLATYLRGRSVFERGRFAEPPSGILLDRSGETV